MDGDGINDDGHHRDAVEPFPLPTEDQDANAPSSNRTPDVGKQ
jgi:hypothetical protein